MWWPFKHRHKWEPTAWNVWGIEVEQRCKCDAYRHHLFADVHGVPLGGEPRWQEGRHPRTPVQP